jgi:prepilin-type N-terminal cleavage/methylation domain-containing protein
MTSRQRGFTLLEVMLTVVILGTMTISVSSLLKAGINVREGLSEQARVLHRLQVAMEKINDDLMHAYYISPRDVPRNGIGRTLKTLFRIDKELGVDKLVLTTKTHRPIRAGANEAEFTLAIYELRESHDVPGRKDLFRTETPSVPEDPKDVPAEGAHVLAKSIKTMTFEAWNGQQWSKEYWDTNRGDTRNLLPKLVRVTLEAWTHEREPDEKPDPAEEEATQRLSTVVYLVDSWEYADLKEQDKTVRWTRL